MSNSDFQSPDNHSEWQLLAEFMIPGSLRKESQALEHITGTLGQLGLEAEQLSRILSAIDQSLQSLEGNITPLHLRISVSGVDLSGMLPADRIDHQQDMDLAGRGLSFFIVKRIVGQLQAPEPEKYRLLEVLIYREAGSAKA